ncbi:hypothetical protein NOCA2140030 [metagenome]|uniref:Uncharacterized protein n=1 Tax=metagenome TaxID=256318 RepID=A0A2P2BWS4_9ZZZZ
MVSRQPEAPWSRHFQGPWHADALNPRFPLPLRVAFLAYGSHKANGHAKFRQGEIAKVLCRLDEDGHPIPADRRTVYRAIRQAIEFGLLDEDSKALCLVVPSHRIAGGVGDEYAPCDRHPRPDPASRRQLRAVS